MGHEPCTVHKWLSAGPRHSLHNLFQVCLLPWNKVLFEYIIASSVLRARANPEAEVPTRECSAKSRKLLRQVRDDVARDSPYFPQRRFIFARPCYSFGTAVPEERAFDPADVHEKIDIHKGLYDMNLQRVVQQRLTTGLTYFNAPLLG